jgi:hypothetical protein
MGCADELKKLEDETDEAGIVVTELVLTLCVIVVVAVGGAVIPFRSF